MQSPLIVILDSIVMEMETALKLIILLLLKSYKIAQLKMDTLQTQKVIVFT
jgi:hypothetical protein